MGVIDVTFYEFVNEFLKFRMADRVRPTKVEKLANLNANCYLRFFRVADYEKTTKNSKTKIKMEIAVAMSKSIS